MCHSAHLEARGQPAGIGALHHVGSRGGHSAFYQLNYFVSPSFAHFFSFKIVFYVPWCFAYRYVCLRVSELELTQQAVVSYHVGPRD